MAKQIAVTRVFNAPPEVIWRLWTEPELVKRWWGPKHFTAPVAELDFREGGRSLVSMMAPEEMGGQEYYSTWTYVRIVPLQLIEFIQCLADKEGQRTDPVRVGMPPDFPADIRTVVTLEALAGGRTSMTVTEYADFGTISQFAQLGLEQSIEKMGAIF